MFGRDLLVSIAIVLLFGGYLFAISGVWPPMVAVESGSMEPNLERTDLVFVMDTDRFQPEGTVADTGVVVARDGARTGYGQFGNPGDVIVFEPDGNGDRTPIIHRAMFWVEEGERWVDRANDRFLGGADSCAAVAGCPAPHDGFITKGDDNRAYDQVGAGRVSQPVRPAWVIGTAELRLPGAGWVRLQFG
ncbi:S26 family signal peptidase [Halobacteriales archaeon QH_10_67_13]|nr:MAG: S26 family signal peptidase [Halobacteriales archaeon QH_10_67_13]